LVVDFYIVLCYNLAIEQGRHKTNIIEVNEKYPTQKDCLDHLEKVRWNNQPTCPYCYSKSVTAMDKENRFHCNNCNTSFSVTVGTIFHNTKLPLQKWFLAISIILNTKKGISARQLGRDIHVTKDTAWRISMQIRKAMHEYGELLEGIVEADENYVGGKNKNRHIDKRTTGGQGRGGDDKQAVFGLLQRDGSVKANKVNDVTKDILHKEIRNKVEKNSTIITDEWLSYKGLSENNVHKIVNHGSGQYVIGDSHTNNIENFWSLFKRGFIGQYHQLSKKHLNEYLDEFCFRHNNRDNANVFELVVCKGLGV
jgi:transposase-like protein